MKTIKRRGKKIQLEYWVKGINVSCPTLFERLCVNTGIYRNQGANVRVYWYLHSSYTSVRIYRLLIPPYYLSFYKVWGEVLPTRVAQGYYRDARLPDFIFRETWIYRKLFLVTRDLTALHDPWRTWIINRYSRDFITLFYVIFRWSPLSSVTLICDLQYRAFTKPFAILLSSNMASSARTVH